MKVNVIHTEYKSILVAYFEEDNRKQLLLKLIHPFSPSFLRLSPSPAFLRPDRLLIWCEEVEKERQKEKQGEWERRVHLNIMNKYQTSAVDSNEPQLTSTPWVMALFKQFVTRNNIKICLEEKRKSGFAFTSLTYTFLSIKGPEERGGGYPSYMGIAVELPLESSNPQLSPALSLGCHHTYRRCNCPRISINYGNKSNSFSY